jgi:hypothetical protein
MSDLSPACAAKRTFVITSEFGGLRPNQNRSDFQTSSHSLRTASFAFNAAGVPSNTMQPCAHNADAMRYRAPRSRVSVPPAGWRRHGGRFRRCYVEGDLLLLDFADAPVVGKMSRNSVARGRGMMRLSLSEAVENSRMWDNSPALPVSEEGRRLQL